MGKRSCLFQIYKLLIVKLLSKAKSAIEYQSLIKINEIKKYHTKPGFSNECKKLHVICKTTYNYMQ